ncbi:MAG: RagB/SusD family nutrient uptake outer membrane protein [Salinivirgaceae bacterium]
MKKIISLFLILGAVGFLSSCSDLDVYPSDQVSTGSIAGTADGLINVTNGNYALFKDGLEFQGFQDDNNSYLRQYFQLSDFSSDDIVCGQKTEDPLYYSFTYTHSPDQPNSRYFWYASYKIISGTNTAIQILEDKGDLTEDMQQLLGENYFLRAFSMFNLVRFYAKPYAISNPETDLGIILRLSTSEPKDKARATIQETYDAIISDLEKAELYMNKPRGKEFASKEAAQALLSRVYINMDNFQGAIDASTQVIESKRFSLETESSLPDFFANAISKSETIWLIAFTDSDNRGKFGSIASMLYSDGNSGWGEEFASPSYRELLAKNMNDTRWVFIDTLLDDNDMVSKKNGIEVYYITKFSFQNGDPNLSSPVMFRLSEMYLNRAEAYAKTNKPDLALDDINEIRKNRGLADDLITSVPAGKTILDVVLEEKRLELAFEGHRFFDVFRNKRDMDRTYWGYHIKGLTVGDINLATNPPSTIDNLIIKWDDNSKLYYIPIDEINTNKLCIQN